MSSITTMNEVEVISGELMPAIEITEALFVPNGLDRILAHIKTEVDKHTLDISTERGRKEIASLARKVASSKTRIDEFGKDHVAGIKVKALAVDAERKRSRDFLDKLRDDTRKPLTDWENAEAARVKSHETMLLELAELAKVPFGATLDEISQRIDDADAYGVRDWQEFKMRHDIGREATLMRLTKLWNETKKSQEDRIELARLKEEETRRLIAEREELIKAEAAANAKAEAEAAAERAATAAKDEADRRANESALEAQRQQQEAEERTRRAEEVAAKAVRDAEQATEIERKRVAEDKKTEADATAKREANKRHVASIHREIITFLIALNISEESAVGVITALTQNEIPHVRISY